MHALPGQPDVFICDSCEEILDISCLRGQKIALVYDETVIELHPFIRTSLNKVADLRASIGVSQMEPSARYIEALAQKAVGTQAELIVSVGGGSTIDCAKGIAQLVLGGRPLPQEFESPGQFPCCLPHVAIPTTAGPGAEVSPAMIYRKDDGSPNAIVDARLIPTTVVIVPRLVATLPPFETACCIFDGISHTIESWVSRRSFASSRVLAAMAIRSFCTCLPRLMRFPDDLNTREETAIASLMSSKSLALSGATAVHALVNPLAGRYRLPHGALVAVCLSIVLRRDMSTQAGRTIISALANQVGYASSEAFVGNIITMMESHVRARLPIYSQPPVVNIGILAQRASCDPRLPFHPVSYNRRKIESIYEEVENIVCQIPHRTT